MQRDQGVNQRRRPGDVPADVLVDDAGRRRRPRDQQPAGEPVPRVGLRLDPGVEAAGGDPGQLERARAGVAEQPGAIEHGVGGLAHAGQDEPVLAQEDRHVRALERLRAGRERERLAVAAWRPARARRRRARPAGCGRRARAGRLRRSSTTALHQPPGMPAAKRDRAVDAVDVPAARPAPASSVPSSPMIASSGRAARMTLTAACSALRVGVGDQVGARRPSPAPSTARCARFGRRLGSPPARRQPRLTGRNGLWLRLGTMEYRQSSGRGTT